MPHQTTPQSPQPVTHRTPGYRRPPMRSMRRAVLRAVVWSSSGQV